MRYVPTDFAVWERAAELAWELDRAGRAIPAPDLVIAACALAIHAPVFTFDRHFRLVSGLRVLDRLG
jgi:predicted nucleic acid-binding protein